MSTLESRSVRRREDQRLLTGGGNYASDAQVAGMLHAVLVRSPHAHATVANIDVTAARGMPGVVAVCTAEDLTDVKPIPGGIGFPRPDGSPSAKTDRPLLAQWPGPFRWRTHRAGARGKSRRRPGSGRGGDRRLYANSPW